MTKLQELRLKAGLSQSQLSNKAGVNLKTLQGYEGGKNIDGSKLETLVKLADALGVEFYELLESDELKTNVLRNIRA